MSDFHMPDGWYEPPGDESDEDAEDAAREAYEDAQIERADARRKGDEFA